MKKIAFVDRDGTLIEEPEDFQVDSLGKVRLKPGVMPALRQLVDAGYSLVMVTNQDNLGTDRYPQESFNQVQEFILGLFASQGVRFEAVRVCPHSMEARCRCRKPGVGLVLDLMMEGFDRESSVVIGDRSTDVEFGQRLGIRSFQLDGIEGTGLGWGDLVRDVLGGHRTARLVRKTKETDIAAQLDLDAASPTRISTGLPFFDHLLEQVARHAGIAIELECDGDLAVDAHHTVEDCALVLGQACRMALGDKRGTARYGFVLPLDEAEAKVLIDLSGRPFLKYSGTFRRTEIGSLPTEMIPHFFRSFSDSLKCTLHVSLYGDNDHHKAEAAFKAVGQTLRQAVRREGDQIMTTKGWL